LKIFNLKRIIFCSLIYVLWFLFISFVLRTDSNHVYGYIAAWCTGLWVSALLNMEWPTVVVTFFLFLLIYLVDSFGKYFIFTFPKQIEDFTIVLFTLASSIPIFINYVTQYLVKRFIKIN